MDDPSTTFASPTTVANSSTSSSVIMVYLIFLILLQFLISLVYLLFALAMAITTYISSNVGPFGTHPIVIRFAFLPGIVGSEFGLHYFIFMNIISLFIWITGLYDSNLISKFSLYIVMISSIFLLKNYFTGFKMEHIGKKTMDAYCGVEYHHHHQQQSSSTTTTNPIIYNHHTKNIDKPKKSKLILKKMQLYRVLKKAFFNLRNKIGPKTIVIDGNNNNLDNNNYHHHHHHHNNHHHNQYHHQHPSKWSFSFWKKIIFPLPHLHYPHVMRKKNIPYGSESHFQVLDVYYHSTIKPELANRPILIYTFGSGWRGPGLSTKDTNSLPLIYHMANEKWIVFSIGYRLAPQFKFPTHINDVKKGIEWVRKNAALYGGDIDNMYIAGGSAGGHLSSLAALTDGKDFEPDILDQEEEKKNNQNTTFRACVSLYAVYDFTNRFNAWTFDFPTYLGQLIMRSPIEQEPELYRKSSPIDNIRPDLNIPFLVIHGDYDELVPIQESINFVKRFKEVVTNPDITFMEVPFAHHGFDVLMTPRTMYVVHAIHRYLDKISKKHQSEKLVSLRQRQYQQHLLHQKSRSMSNILSTSTSTTTIDVLLNDNNIDSLEQHDNHNFENQV
ncbi:hypothetical protein CYY_008625 [Polysphondylium violaceum]|uniref:BD-FAE-like domain-containing protein n=1 Tax=Polysphondylium violaceum TaxID=133409 RepID=A0A8J4PP10_9MYCE|nr:hypothetical protein CYY_008625 [Polysphondylium violaceum]